MNTIYIYVYTLTVGYIYHLWTLQLCTNEICIYLYVHHLWISQVCTDDSLLYLNPIYSTFTLPYSDTGIKHP